MAITCPAAKAAAPGIIPTASSSQSPSAPNASAAAIIQPPPLRALTAAHSASKATPLVFHAQIAGPSQRISTAAKKLIPPISANIHRSEEHTTELQSLMRISYAVFCLKTHKNKQT